MKKYFAIIFFIIAGNLMAQNVTEVSLNEILNVEPKEDNDNLAEYFVVLPENYNPGVKYPLIIVLHGGIGDYYSTYKNWKSTVLKNDCISVYPQGAIVADKYGRKYGSRGMDDITEIYQQVIFKYPVDTSKIILSGQSLGGHLSLQLACTPIPVCGLILAYPVKPKQFNYEEALVLKEKDVFVTMICGEKDGRFFAGQKKLANILDSANVNHVFITYPKLGHWFPEDFSEQMDNALEKILK